MQPKQLLLTSLLRFIGGKFSLGCMFVFLMVWEAQPTGPEWKDIAIAALSLVTAIASIAFSMFLFRLNRMEKDIAASAKAANDARAAAERSLTEQRDKQDRRHQSNLKVMVALIQAVKTGDCDELDLDDLFTE